MSKSYAAAIAALESRIDEFRMRLSHAEYASDFEKADRIRIKLARAMARLTRLRRKAR